MLQPKTAEVIKELGPSVGGDFLGSGGGSVGRAVASDTIDLRFKSHPLQNFIVQSKYRKDENKEKEAANGPS